LFFSIIALRLGPSVQGIKSHSIYFEEKKATPSEGNERKNRKLLKRPGQRHSITNGERISMETVVQFL